MLIERDRLVTREGEDDDENGDDDDTDGESILEM